MGHTLHHQTPPTRLKHFSLSCTVQESVSFPESIELVNHSFEQLIWCQILYKIHRISEKLTEAMLVWLAGRSVH